MGARRETPRCVWMMASSHTDPTRMLGIVGLRGLRRLSHAREVPANAGVRVQGGNGVRRDTLVRSQVRPLKSPAKQPFLLEPFPHSQGSTRQIGPEAHVSHLGLRREPQAPPGAYKIDSDDRTARSRILPLSDCRRSGCSPPLLTSYDPRTTTCQGNSSSEVAGRPAMPLQRGGTRRVGEREGSGSRRIASWRTDRAAHTLDVRPGAPPQALSLQRRIDYPRVGRSNLPGAAEKPIFGLFASPTSRSRCRSRRLPRFDVQSRGPIATRASRSESRSRPLSRPISSTRSPAWSTCCEAHRSSRPSTITPSATRFDTVSRSRIACSSWAPRLPSPPPASCYSTAGTSAPDTRQRRP